MPKGLFEQPIKKEPSIEEMRKKLDKAEKMVEEVEEIWKEEFEMVEKSVEELKKLWEESEEEIEGMTRSRVFSFFYSLPLPETSPSFLERVSNKFLKEFDWKKFKGVMDLNVDLGLFLSAFLKKNIENYILSQKRKGVEEEKIKPIEVHLRVKGLPIVLNFLGYQNPEKLHLIIEGDCGSNTGQKMQDGKIIVKGNCGWHTGCKMQGGRIIVEGNCEGWTGTNIQGGKIIVKGNCKEATGYEMEKGEIIVEGNCGDWTGEIMQGGKIIVEGNCGDKTGHGMQGGELNIKGEVKSFNLGIQGTIIWKNIKIWENGLWTKEGKEMWEEGEIPVE